MHSSHSPSNRRIQNFGTTVINVNNKERVLSAVIGAFFLSRGIRKLSLMQTILGGYFLYRGASGHCALYSQLQRSGYTDKPESVNIKATLIVNKPVGEVYNFWRKLENLPLFMTHLKSVKDIDDKRSRWEANIPGKVTTINWDAEIVKEEPERLIAWRSLPGATIENAGKVEFQDALGHQGTELRVVITYRPPAGAVGSSIAWLLNPVFRNMLKKDIRGFKDYIETGKLVN